MKIVGQDAEIFFGDMDTDEEGDWRTELIEDPDEDDNDEEELTTTPQHVIDILGFDYRDEEPEEKETTMSLNTVRAILILNAKNPKVKGWTDQARKKAALTRKAKKKASQMVAKKKEDGLYFKSF